MPLPVASKTNRGILKRLLPVALTVCLGVGASVVAFVAVRAWEHTRLRVAFERTAEDHAGVLDGIIRSDLLVLELLERFYAGSEKVERHEFEAFVRPIPRDIRCLRALAWVPWVPASEREAFEAATRQEGLAGFQITEFGADGRMVRAGPRDEYFPVHFLRPIEGNEQALGFDLGSEPTRRAAVEAARDSGEMRGTGRIRLVQETSDQWGLLAILPVYRKGVALETVEQRRAALEGFILATFRLGDLLERVGDQLGPRGADVALYDVSAPEGERLLAWRSSRLRGDVCEAPPDADLPPLEGMYHAATFHPAGRTWVLVCTPCPEFLARAKEGDSWALLVGGLGFTALLAAYFAVTARRAVEVERLANRLLEGNAKLEAQVLERKRAEDEVRSLKTQIEFILGATQTGLDIIDADFNVRYVDPQWQKVYGDYTGRKCYEYFMGRSDPCPGCGIPKALKDKAITVTEEVLVKENSRPVQVTTIPYQMETGEWLVAEVNVDISERKRVEQALEEANRRLEELATTDDLTGLANRRQFMKLLESEFQRSRRYGGGLALVMVDVDHFKVSNDTYGHVFGDRVLQSVAGMLKREARETDVVARLGGDEFVLLMPHAASDEAHRAAERIRRLVADQAVSDGKHTASLTVSMGVATADPSASPGGETAEAGGAGDGPEGLLRRADEALYAAKEAGRNRVCAAPAGVPHRTS